MQAAMRQCWTAKPTQILWRLLGNALVFSFALLLANRSAQAQYFAYVANATDGTVSVIDTMSNTVVAAVTVGASPMSAAASPDGSFVYVANASNPGTVSVINTSTNNVVATIPVGNVPIGVTVAPNGKFAYVSNTGDDTISVIDTFAQSVTATIPLPAGICGPNSPCGIVFTQMGAYAYVAGNSSNRVAVINTATNTVTSTISTSAQTGGTIAISPDQSTVYVPLYFGYVSVISTNTNTQTATWSLNGGGSGINLNYVAVTPDSATVYIEASGQNRIIVVPAATGTPSASILVGNNPFGLAMTPDGAYIYVLNSNDATVSVIQVATNSVVGTIQVGNGPSGVAIAKPLDYAFLNGGNSFNGNQVINGNVSATNFAGNGAGLTNVVAAGLACAGCITNSQLGINYAGSTSQGGPATDALLLDGLAATSFASTGANSFTGDQNITGNLTATGAVNASSLNLTGPFSTSNLVLPPGGTATASQGFNSGALDSSASLFNSTASSAQNLLFRWQAEPVASSNNTANPTATLNLLYGANGTPSETGLSLNANGTINFAAGQTFPGAGGSGSITGVTAGTGLSGGGTSGNVTLNLANSACAAGSALTALPFTCSPFASTGANSYSGNQSVTGTVTATAFSGDGSALTNVSAATAANALALGGLAPSAYATTGGNTFSGSQTISSGNLALPNTSSSGASGVITLGGIPFVHNFGAGSGAAGNTFIGQGAGNFTMAATENTVSGYNALSLNTTGSGNTASGFRALGKNSTGSYNTASGTGVLYSNTTGIYNTVSGVEGLTANTTGSFNTAVGANTGTENSSGSYNTFLGYSSGPGTGNPLTNATAVGSDAVVSASNALVLGSINGVNGATSNVNVGIGTATPAYSLDVEGGQINASGGLCIAGTCWTALPTAPGTISSITAGAGLTGGTITSSGTIAVDPTYVATLSGTNSFSGSDSFTNTISGSISGTASNITATSNSTLTSLPKLTSVGTLANLTVTSPIVGNIAGSAASAANFSGTLTGDVTGTQSTTTVDAIQGVPVSNTTPTAGQVLWYNGREWLPNNESVSSLPWSDLIAGGNMTLNNGTNSTTFNQTDAAVWTWANTSSAQPGSSQNSPELELVGGFWGGSGSVYDIWTIQSSPGGTNGDGSGLFFEHGGESGAASVNVPNLTDQALAANSGDCVQVSAKGLLTAASGPCGTGNASGTVTSVATGAGLTGGPITSSGTISVANGGITNAMLAANSVTSADLASGSVTSPAIAPGTIVDSNISSTAAISPTKINGTAATLGANIFSGTQTMPNLTVAGEGTFGNGASSVSGVVATSYSSIGVSGQSISSIGVSGSSENLFGVFGASTNSVGVGGVSVSGPGVTGQTSSTAAYSAAGAFNNVSGAGNILLGLSNGSPEFTVDAKGDVIANGAVTIGSGGTPISESISVTYDVSAPGLGVITAETCTTLPPTAALNGFTPGSSDTIALGVPSSLTTNLGSGIFLIYQAWETSTATSPTITIQICNPTAKRYAGGAMGTIRVDVFKH